MNAEALIGKVAGGCLLQQVAGVGTMGVVYRASQSQPSRPVAVKMMTRAASLELPHQIEFLESFRGVVAQSAALHHQHIVSIYEYGDHDGLAYLVMPHIQGVTLEELLNRRGALPLEQALHYLDLIARALDYAHTRGIVHCDLKPANVFITHTDSALVADFQLTKALTEGSIAQMRLSRPGMLDYMSPELVVGKEVDGRADIYSLGALLFRMVTGVAPFQGQTLMKVATRHLKMPPPSPRELRPDLPPAAEQAILKALAKKPEDRYESALDLAILYQQALRDSVTHAPLPLPGAPQSVQKSFPAQPQPAALRSPSASRGTARAPWRAEALTAVPAESTDQEDRESSTTGSFSSGRRALFAESAHQQATDPRFSLRNTGEAITGPQGSMSVEMGEAITGPQGSASFQKSQPITPAAPSREEHAEQPEQSIPPRLLHNALATRKLTHALPGLTSPQDNTGATGTWKLDVPAKIVSIPVAGQPGQFVTGILSTQQLRNSQDTPADVALPAPTSLFQRAIRWRKQLALLSLALLVVFGSLSFWLVHNAVQRPSSQTTLRQSGAAGTPDLAASATAKAVATLNASTILYDPLTQNIRDWLVVNSGPILYQFGNGAYNITNNDPSRIAPAILQGEDLDQSFAYTLTMEEIHGDDTSINNEFGMIIRFSSQAKNGSQVVTFYSFEVLNKPGGEYQFWKYDNSAGSSSSPWTELAKHPFGSEFHEGHGPKNANTFTILVDGKNFTLTVNGKQVWKVSDGSLTRGGVGMLVNLKGTEVAFSNLRLSDD